MSQQIILHQLFTVENQIRDGTRIIEQHYKNEHESTDSAPTYVSTYMVCSANAGHISTSTA